MSFIKRTLKRIISNIMYSDDYDGPVKSQPDDFNEFSKRDRVSPADDPVLSFRIYSAENGKIVEFNKYNERTDRCERAVYVLKGDEDISNRVAKCLTVELAK